jgi:hypothetical protein
MMAGYQSILASIALAVLLGGCSKSSDDVAKETLAKLDTYRELRAWMREDLGDRSGLRISPSGIGDYRYLAGDWVHGRKRTETLSEVQVAEALGMSSQRIKDYLETAAYLEINFANQFPGDTGYASLYESPTASASGCVALLHWGSPPASDATHLADDWSMQWLCE